MSKTTYKHRLYKKIGKERADIIMDRNNNATAESKERDKNGRNGKEKFGGSL